MRAETKSDLLDLTGPLLCVVILLQAPLVPHGTPVVNALAKQRAMLENIMRACVGLPPDNNMVSTVPRHTWQCLCAAAT